MPEVSRKVVPYQYNYVCDKCDNGMMRASGEKGEDGLYPHKCMICGNTASLKNSYPRVEYYGEEDQPVNK